LLDELKVMCENVLGYETGAERVMFDEINRGKKSQYTAL
jgi:hypothetical protein